MINLGGTKYLLVNSAPDERNYYSFISDFDIDTLNQQLKEKIEDCKRAKNYTDGLYGHGEINIFGHEITIFFGMSSVYIITLDEFFVNNSAEKLKEFYAQFKYE